MTVFETPGQVALRVSLSGGEVNIETVDAPRVEIELVALRDNDVTRQAIEEARVEMTDRGGGHQVVVELKRKSGFIVGRGPRVGVNVRCPAGTDVDLRADDYEVVLREAYAHPAVEGVVFWGFMQGHMWRQDACLVNSDGTVNCAGERSVTN
jgi:hypothetical protein